MKIIAEITIPDGRERFDYEARIKGAIVEAMVVPGLEVRIIKEVETVKAEVVVPKEKASAKKKPKPKKKAKK